MITTHLSRRLDAYGKSTCRSIAPGHLSSYRLFEATLQVSASPFVHAPIRPLAKFCSPDSAANRQRTSKHCDISATCAIYRSCPTALRGVAGRLVLLLH
jgi:hypothetical protein